MQENSARFSHRNGKRKLSTNEEKLEIYASPPNTSFLPSTFLLSFRVFHSHRQRRKNFFLIFFLSLLLLRLLLSFRKYWWNYFYLFIDFFLFSLLPIDISLQLHFLHFCTRCPWNGPQCVLLYSMKKSLDSFGDDKNGIINGGRPLVACGFILIKP